MTTNDNMRSLFVIVDHKRGSLLKVCMRVACEEAGVEVIDVASVMPPIGYEYVDSRLSVIKNSNGTGSNGRRRNVSVRFKRDPRVGPIGVLAARKHFAPAWEAAQCWESPRANRPRGAHRRDSKSTSRS